MRRNMKNENMTKEKKLKIKSNFFFAYANNLTI